MTVSTVSPRRTRGTGSLSTRRDKNGREMWVARVHVGAGKYRKQALGSCRVRGSSVGLTRVQAERELHAFMDRLAAAPDPVTERVTVAEAGARLVADLEARGRKRSTVEAVESHVRVHFAPFFADRALESVTRRDVEAFVAVKRTGGLAPKSIRNLLGALHSIFALGEDREWCRANPVRLVRGPQSPGGEAEVRFLKLEELEAVLRAAPSDLLGPTERVLYLAAAMTGARQGELLALQWRDVDWTASKVRIRRSWVRGEFGSPKSKRSSRAVPLADRLAAELDLHFQSSAWTADDDLCFGHPATGRPLDRSKVLKRFKSALKRAGVRTVRFHDLRHTFATRAAAAGVPMRMLQEWMGHADFKTTLIYADYSPSSREAELLEAAFAPAEPVAVPCG